MSDVILYAALKENLRLNNDLLTLCAGGSSVSIESYEEDAVATGSPYGSDSGAAGEECTPTIVSNWVSTLKPFVETRANGMKTCDNSGCFRCGSQCNWTVPSGVTNVQFQLWGPGGGTSQNCCCGGAPFGPSGAYAVVQMDVTAGDVYCLCGGCAYCCCAHQNTPGLCGSPTFISGPGLCVCADSGISCYCYWGTDINASMLGSGGCGPPHFGNCGPESCSGWNFCWDSGSDDMDTCHAFSRQTWHTTCKNVACNITAYGINGMWPRMTIANSLNNSGTYSISPPVFGFESMTCCKRWDGTTCHGHCQQGRYGYQAGPGFGGFASTVFSGCGACGGDHGGMGMVCVSWA